jgi:aryl-alcohol dehydrogenase-like predicted oxidoreductase
VRATRQRELATLALVQQRALGRSGLVVPPIAFGAWAIGGWQWGGSDDAAAIDAIRAGIAAGVTAIDTAPIYGFGRSEEVVGRAIAGRRAEVTILTKAGLRWDSDEGELAFDGMDGGRPLRIHRNARPASLRAEVEASLRRLGVEQIDLLQIHWPDRTTPVAESMGALLELKREGKIRAIGVSNFTPELLEQAQRALGDVPLASTQERYSLLARGIESGVLPWARAHEVGVLAYSPLEQGLLTGKVVGARTFPTGDERKRRALFSAENRLRVNAALERSVQPISQRLGATDAQVVIAWTIAQPGITCALVGARTAAQARENAHGAELELTRDELDSIGRDFAELQLAGPRSGWLRRLLSHLTGAR